MIHSRIFFPSTVVRLTLMTALIFGSSISAFAAEKEDGKDLTKSSLLLERCQNMQREHQKMIEDMKAQDADLSDRVTKMNAATDDKKLALVADLITHMVEQRAAMVPRMERMQAMMMPHIMEHMQLGTASMAQCPMMKDVKDMKDMKDMEKNEIDDMKELKDKRDMQNMKGGLTK